MVGKNQIPIIRKRSSINSTGFREKGGCTRIADTMEIAVGPCRQQTTVGEPVG